MWAKFVKRRYSIEFLQPLYAYNTIWIISRLTDGSKSGESFFPLLPSRTLKRTGHGCFDKVSSYFWFTASEGWRGETRSREEGGGGRLVRGSTWALQRLRGWKVGGLVDTGSDTSPKGVVTIRQRCQLLRPQPLNNLPVLTTRPHTVTAHPAAYI